MDYCGWNFQGALERTDPNCGNINVIMDSGINWPQEKPTEPQELGAQRGGNVTFRNPYLSPHVLFKTVRWAFLEGEALQVSHHQGKEEGKRHP